MSRISIVSLAGILVLTGTVGAQQFEVASIRENKQGYIDLGGGARVLSGRTRCQTVDSPDIPGDPIPAPGPGRCVARNMTVKELINVAYGLRFGPARTVLNHFIPGGPRWTETTSFDVEAKAESPSVTTQNVLAMLRDLLVSRFHLTFHRENRETTALALVVSKDGHKLKPGDVQAKPSFVAAPVMRGENVPVTTLANFLTQRLGRPVVDRTGLTGVYSISLAWSPDPTELLPNGAPVGGGGAADQVNPSLTTALQEQLGLRLDSQRLPVEAFVIDSIDMPTPN
jgi:uncharacterized protein (TIGR03435 family)